MDHNMDACFQQLQKVRMTQTLNTLSHTESDTTENDSNEKRLAVALVAH